MFEQVLALTAKVLLAGWWLFQAISILHTVLLGSHLELSERGLLIFCTSIVWNMDVNIWMTPVKFHHKSSGKEDNVCLSKQRIWLAAYCHSKSEAVWCLGNRERGTSPAFRRTPSPNSIRIVLYMQLQIVERQLVWRSGNGIAPRRAFLSCFHLCQLAMSSCIFGK